MNIKKNSIQKIIFFTFVCLLIYLPLANITPIYSNSILQENQSLIPENTLTRIIIEAEKDSVIKLADQLLTEKLVTVTAYTCERSAGGKHDYYSEGDYWWPDSLNPAAPYKQRDGMSNPDNFTHHRKAIGQFSWIVGTQTSAYLLTGKEQYAYAALSHLKAWFVDTATRMNPHFLYAQAISGVCTGRGIGIIDATAFIEVAQSVSILEKSPYTKTEDIAKIKDWFNEFLLWLTTHQYGIDEMNWKNNHGTWWHTQAVAFARLTGNTEVIAMCRDHYTSRLLPMQMAGNGSFPLELARTKPYSYSLFNMEGMAALAWMLTDKEHDLWNYTLPDGRRIKKGIEFIFPYIKNINLWPYPKDIAYWEDQPRRVQFLIFAALATDNKEFIDVWKTIDSKYPNDESRRNAPLKNPVLWLNLPDPN